MGEMRSNIHATRISPLPDHGVNLNQFLGFPFNVDVRSGHDRSKYVFSRDVDKRSGQ